jgi:hypothetical protein
VAGILLAKLAHHAGYRCPALQTARC